MEGSIMHLLTKKIEEKATKQYKLGSDLEKQNVVAKFFNPAGDGTWYLMNMKDKDYRDLRKQLLQNFFLKFFLIYCF